MLEVHLCLEGREALQAEPTQLTSGSIWGLGIISVWNMYRVLLSFHYSPILYNNYLQSICIISGITNNIEMFLMYIGGRVYANIPRYRKDLSIRESLASGGSWTNPLRDNYIAYQGTEKMPTSSQAIALWCIVVRKQRHFK